MAKTQNKILINFINQLTNIGETAIRTAYATSNFRNRSYNLYDSYASAVYVNGRLYRDTIRFVGASKSRKDLETQATQKGRGWKDKWGRRFEDGDTVTIHGRSEVDRFFADYQPERRGIELVVVAAMFYASILEREGFVVISKAIDVLSSYRNVIGGDARLYGLDVYRDLSKYSTGSFTITKRALSL